MPEPQPPESAGTALADDLETTGLVSDAFTVEVAGVTAGVQPTRKKRLGIGAWLAIVWLVGLVLAAVVAPILPIAGPNETFTSIQRGQAPFSTITSSGGGTTTPFAEGHLLGGDRNGHDLLSRAIYGARELADRRLRRHRVRHPGRGVAGAAGRLLPRKARCRHRGVPRHHAGHTRPDPRVCR